MSGDGLDTSSALSAEEGAEEQSANRSRTSEDGEARVSPREAAAHMSAQEDEKGGAENRDSDSGDEEAASEGRSPRPVEEVGVEQEKAASHAADDEDEDEDEDGKANRENENGDDDDTAQNTRENEPEDDEEDEDEEGDAIADENKSEANSEEEGDRHVTADVDTNGDMSLDKSEERQKKQDVDEEGSRDVDEETNGKENVYDGAGEEAEARAEPDAMVEREEKDDGLEKSRESEAPGKDEEMAEAGEERAGTNHVDAETEDKSEGEAASRERDAEAANPSEHSVNDVEMKEASGERDPDSRPSDESNALRAPSQTADVTVKAEDEGGAHASASSLDAKDEDIDKPAAPDDAERPEPSQSKPPKPTVAVGALPPAAAAGVDVSASKAQLAAKLKGRPQAVQGLKVGGVVVRRLGSVVSDRPAFHSRRFLYPVGFCSERSYASYRQPGQQTTYTCEVLDGGEGPEFRICVQDDGDNPIVAATPTAAWRVVEQRVQAVPPAPGDTSRPQAGMRLCGAAYFGLAHPSVMRLLCKMPGANRCQSFMFSRKQEQMSDQQEEEAAGAGAASDGSATAIRSAGKAEAGREVLPPPQPQSAGAGAGAGQASKEKKEESVEAEGWLPQVQQELQEIKTRTRQTIQPLSHSQLQPEGWSAAEVDTFFNGLNEHQMQMANIAGAIGSKSTQQVYHYAEYVCDVMDRRVKASREEQLQKQAAALANAQQSGSAHDAGAAALQAAVAAFSVAPKEGTQLKEMLRSPASHGTLAQVLTHLWHTERLWRHALQQGLQLFNETHLLSDRMVEHLVHLRNRVKVQAAPPKGAVNETAVKRKVEAETQRYRAEVAEKQRRLLDSEKQIKKVTGEHRRARQELEEAQAAHAQVQQDLRDIENSRDTAAAQVAESRGQLLKEQKARHALMLRKERLESEVVRLRSGLEAEQEGTREQRAEQAALQRRCADLAEQAAAERASVEKLEQQLIRLGHVPCIDSEPARPRPRTDTPAAAPAPGQSGFAPGRLAALSSVAMRGVKRGADGNWVEPDTASKRPRGVP